MDRSYRVILSSGESLPLPAASFEPLRSAIRDRDGRHELYLVNEDGPYIVPAHVVAIEIVHPVSSGTLAPLAATVDVEAMSPSDVMGVDATTLTLPDGE